MEKNPSLGTYSYNEYATGAKRYGTNASLAPTTGPVDKTGYRERDAAIAARKNNMMQNKPAYGKPQMPSIQNKPVYGKGPIGGTTPGGRPSRPNQMTQGMGQSQVAQPAWMDNIPMGQQTKPMMNGKDPMMQAQIYKNWLRDNATGAYNSAATNRMGR